MITFRDMTFCTSDVCTTPWCARRLTPDVYSEARKWWDDRDPPIAQKDFTASCKEYRGPSRD